MLLKLKDGLFSLLQKITYNEEIFRDKFFGWSIYIFGWLKPNSLSKFRFVLSAFLYFPIQSKLALFVALFAYFTDIIDGVLARKNNQVTLMGKILDLTADLFLRFSVFIYLARSGLISWFLFSIIVLTEILFALVLAKVASKRGDIIEHSFIGRLRGVIYAFGSLWLLLGLNKSIGQNFFFLGLNFSLFATIDYLFRQKTKRNSYKTCKDYNLFMRNFYKRILLRLFPFVAIFVVLPSILSILIFSLTANLPKIISIFVYIELGLIFIVCLASLSKLGLYEIAKSAKEVLLEISPTLNLQAKNLSSYDPELVLRKVEEELKKFNFFSALSQKKYYAIYF